MPATPTKIPASARPVTRREDACRRLPACYTIRASREHPIWRGGRVVECAGFEIRCTVSPYRGFESHPLRHIVLLINGLRLFFATTHHPPKHPAGWLNRGGWNQSGSCVVDGRWSQGAMTYTRGHTPRRSPRRPWSRRPCSLGRGMTVVSFAQPTFTPSRSNSPKNTLLAPMPSESAVRHAPSDIRNSARMPGGVAYRLEPGRPRRSPRPARAVS